MVQYVEDRSSTTQFELGQMFHQGKEKARDYVAASRVIGCSTPRIIFKHILPNAVAILVTHSMIWRAVSLRHFVRYDPSAPDRESDQKDESSMFHFFQIQRL